MNSSALFRSFCLLVLFLVPQRILASDVLPAYSVVSVRPHKGQDERVEILATEDGFRASNVTLRALIGYAYTVYSHKVQGGPSWVSSDSFDIFAKVSDADIARLKTLRGQERRAMLKSILADRFGLSIRIDRKMEDVLEITAPAGEKKLQRSQKSLEAGSNESDRGYVQYGHLVAHDQTMVGLATQLSFPLQQRVVDRTGLSGKYDFELRWTPDESEARFLSPAENTEGGPSIYTAMKEQLGLRLKASKEAVDAIVIVSVHRPSEN